MYRYRTRLTCRTTNSSEEFRRIGMFSTVSPASIRYRLPYWNFFHNFEWNPHKPFDDRVSRSRGALNENVSSAGNKKANDCLLWTDDRELALKMPIPFTTNGKRHSIVYPDDKGRLPVRYGKSFKLSCATSEFASAELRNVSEVLVNCAGGNQLRHRGKTCKCVEISQLARAGLETGN